MSRFSSHAPVAIANYFISKSNGPLTLMQVLKLAYIAHGFKLGLSSGPLSKELVQAWKYGPVFPSIYDEFKWQPPKEIKKLGTGESEIPITSSFDDHDRQVMDFVYDVYGKLSGWELSALTHKEDSPWHKYYYETEPKGEDFNGVTIPNKEIEEYYRDKVLAKFQQVSRD